MRTRPLAWSFGAVLVVSSAAVAPAQEAPAPDPTREILVALHRHTGHLATLGERASANAQLRGLRAFGRRLARVHTRAHASVTTLAERKGVELETAPSEAARTEDVDRRERLARLDELEGAGFDRELLTELLEEYDHRIPALESARDRLADRELRRVVERVLAGMRSERERARDLVIQLPRVPEAKGEGARRG